MTLFGFCPNCGYPWYCMCDTCEPDAPEYVKGWTNTNNPKDGVVCPDCGSAYNYDELVEICDNQKNMLKAIRNMCNGCMEYCGTCSIVKFAKPEDWYSKLFEAERTRTEKKTCEKCWNALCMFMHSEEERSVERNCPRWEPINQHDIRMARKKRLEHMKKSIDD